MIRRQLRSGLPLYLLAMLLCASRWAAGQPEEPLSLAATMAEALNHNPQIAAAVPRVKRAGAGVDLAASRDDPAFTFSAAGRLQGPVQEITIPLAPARTIRITRAEQANAGLTVAWPLWTGGRVSAAIGAARAETSAAEADLQQATEQLLYEVGLAYYGVLQKRSARAAAAAPLDRANEDERVARVAQRAGTVTQAQVSAAVAARRRAEEALAAAGSAVADAEQRFNKLLARELDATVALADDPITLEPRQMPDDATQIALKARPELLALAHRRDAARAAIAQARAERNPTLAAVAQATVQTNTEVMKGHSEFVGLEFSWPILHTPEPRAQERAAHAAAGELAETERELRAVIALQAAEAGRRVTDARERLAAAAETHQAADDAAREAEAAHRAGTATRRALLAAQERQTAARCAHAQAEYGRSMALLSQARALGLMRALFLAPAEEAGQ